MQDIRLSDYFGKRNKSFGGLYIESMASSAWRYWLEQGVQTLVGWIPTAAGIGIRALCYRFLLSRESADSIYAEAHADIRYLNEIRCGKRVYVDRNTRLHASPAGIFIGDYSKIMFGSYLCSFTSDMSSGEGIHIGRECWIGMNNVLHGGRGGVWIGDRTLLGPHVIIVCGEHDSNRAGSPVDRYEQRPIRIGENCWLGAGAIVLGGVTLGNNVTVAAGAVVAHSFGDNLVIGGVPARVLRDHSCDEKVDGKTNGI